MYFKNYYIFFQTYEKKNIRRKINYFKLLSKMKIKDFDKSK